MADAMFDRFTDRARKIMGLSRQEAQRCSHDYIGTEHFLLGLLLEGSGVACDALVNVDADPKQIRAEVERRMTHGTARVTMGQLPFTPRAKHVLELAYEEASNLGYNYIGSEHLLLGMIREREGLAAQALRAARVEYDEVREEIVELLGSPDAVTILLLGFEDDSMPREIAARVRGMFSANGMELCETGCPTAAIAFVPGCGRKAMYTLGLVHGRGTRVILLHLPEKKYRLPRSESLEVDDDLPQRLEALFLDSK